MKKFFRNLAISRTVSVLSKLDDRLLEDIGITRSEIRAHVLSRFPE